VTADQQHHSTRYERTAALEFDGSELLSPLTTANPLALINSSLKFNNLGPRIRREKFELVVNPYLPPLVQEVLGCSNSLISSGDNSISHSFSLLAISGRTTEPLSLGAHVAYIHAQAPTQISIELYSLDTPNQSIVQSLYT